MRKRRGKEFSQKEGSREKQTEQTEAATLAAP